MRNPAPSASVPEPVRAVPAAAPELQALVERHADALVRLAARVLGSAAEAEDVVQEAWARALVALRRNAFRGAAELHTWLHRLVLNEALNARRGRERRSAREQAFAQHRGTVLEGKPDAGLALQRIAALLDELPADQASALVLKELHGMAQSEVAKVLECSEGAVEQRLVRARATLRKRYSDG